MLDDDIKRFVVTQNQKITGIVTETDVAVAMRKFRELVEDKHQDHRVRNLLVKDIMSSPALTVAGDVGLDDVVDVMLEKKIGSIPVVNEGKLLGLITRESLLKAL